MTTSTPIRYFRVSNDHAEICQHQPPESSNPRNYVEAEDRGGGHLIHVTDGRSQKREPNPSREHWMKCPNESLCMTKMIRRANYLLLLLLLLLLRLLQPPIFF